MNVLSLLLLNILFFICNIFPKHILEINSPQSVLSVIFNLLFYLIFAWLLIVSINKNKNFFSTDIFTPFEKFSRKIELKKILLVCATQICIDIISLLLNTALNENILYAKDCFAIISWVAFYNICATKENNIFRNKKSIAAVIVFAVLLVLTTYANYHILEEYSFIAEKYYIDSSRAKEAINNLDFLFAVKNFLLDSFSGITLLVLHRVFNKINSEEQYKAVKQIIRSFCLICIALIMIGIKYLICPYFCINSIDTRISDAQNYSSKNILSATTKTTTVERIDSTLSGKIFFQKTKNKIFYKGNLIFEYSSNDAIDAHSFEKNGNQITINDCFEKMVYNDVEFYLYKNEVIVFFNNDVPTAVYNGNIRDNNESLTAIYRSLIENNNWDFFEQGAEYLLNYDENFIKPYLERFSSGKFSEEEIVSLKELYINAEYIQNVSKAALT